MTRKKRRGAYDCRLWQRAVNAEGKLRMVMDAHDRCVQVRDYRINELQAQVEQLLKINGVLVRKAGGSASLDLVEIQDERINGTYIETLGDNMIRIVHVPDKDEDKEKA